MQSFIPDLSGENGWNATVAESASVRWWWVFAAERKVHVATLTLLRLIQQWVL